MTTRTHNIKIGILPGAARTGGRAVKKELKGIDDSAKRVRQTITRTFALLGSGALITSGINTLRQYEQQIGSVRALIGRSEKDFKNLSAAAEGLGRTTRFSATQAAAGLEFLGRAGFDANEAIGALNGTLQLAQVGQLSVARSADIASNVLSGFQLGTAETARVVDVLALASARSNTNVEQLGEGLKLVAPIAAGLGVDIETTAAAIGKLSDAGLQGTLAGTGLRRVLSELENPGTTAAKVFEELGINIDDLRITTEGNGGLVGALTKLKDAGVDTADALEAFGQRGGPAFQVLVNAIPGVTALNGELEKSAGFAKTTADIMDDNLNGAFLKVQSAIEGFVIALGKLDENNSFTKALIGLADGINFVTDNIDIAAQTVTEFGTVLGLVFGARLVAGAVAGMASMATGATGLTLAITALRGALFFLAGPAGVIALAASAFLVFNSRAEEAQRNLKLLNVAAESNVRGLGKLSVDQLREQIDLRDKAVEALGKEQAALEEQQKLLKGAPRDLRTGKLRDPAKRRSEIQIEERLAEVIDFQNLKRQEALVLQKQLSEELQKVKPTTTDTPTVPTGPTNDPVALGRTVQQILAELQAEEVALQAKTAAGRQLALQLLSIEDEVVGGINDKEREALRIQLLINEQTARRGQLLDEIEGPQLLLQERQEDLLALQNQGVDVTRQLLELEIERANLAAQNALTFDEGFAAELNRQIADSRFAFADLGKEVASIFGPGGTLNAGIARSVADSVVFGKSFTGALKGIGQSIVRDLIENFVKVRIQQLIIAKTGQAEAAASTAAGVAQAGTLASAYAPAAGLASLATSGGNSAGALSAITTVLALVGSLAAVKGFATGGFVPGNGSGTADDILARISSGEFVVNAAATKRFRPLLEGINSGNVTVPTGITTQGTSTTISLGGISVSANTEADADAVADRVKEVVLDVIADERRVGGILEVVD